MHLPDVDVVSSVDEDLRHILGHPRKRRKMELKEERSRMNILNRRFKDPLRRANIEHFKAKINSNEEHGYTFDQAVHLAVNKELPHLR